jgi:hypothetical protein
MSDNPRPRPGGKSIREALIIAGVQVVGVLLLTLARKQGMIDGETAIRGVMVLIGLGIIRIGNRMPKMLDGPPAPSLAIAALQQTVHRVGGWAMMLGGLAWVGLWVFAPRDVAQVGSVVSVGAGVAVMFANFAWQAFAYHRSSTS